VFEERAMLKAPIYIQETFRSVPPRQDRPVATFNVERQHDPACWTTEDRMLASMLGEDRFTMAMAIAEDGLERVFGPGFDEGHPS
jgi:hypothetical protein